MVNTISIALSGLNSSVQRLNASASNIANLNTTGSLEEGGQAPYSALTTTTSSIAINGETAGVRTNVIPKNTPFVPAYSPDSPFANEEGLIGVPNINLAEEIVNSKLAELSYKANIQTIRIQQDLNDELLSVFDKRV